MVGATSMKTVLSTAAAFFIAGAVGGYGYEAVALRQNHAQGFVLPLTDFIFEIIYALIFGIMGCLAGLIILALYWSTRRSRTRVSPH